MSIVLVISAPSGTGKSTLVGRLVDRDPRLEFAVSVTTRPPRRHEVDGSAYRFVSRESFFGMRNRGEFIEWAEVFGNFYGTPWSAVDEARSRECDLVLDIDVQGGASLIERLPGAVTVFILPPSKEELERRLRERSADRRAVIERRLGEAVREIRGGDRYDYVLVNERIDESVAVLHSILVAERSRRVRMERAVEPVLRSFGMRAENRSGETE